ncbi:MAG: hypothetical protein IKR81_10505, partial [Victivallales bacterium]|nr:hypothetical protein [Victivallales bacterium]
IVRDQDGTYQVNFYQDATATLDGVTFTIRGNYPVGDTVTVTVSSPDAKVRFRKPGWCPQMDVTQNGSVYTLHFDMAPRIVHRSTENIAVDANDPNSWPYKRYQCVPMAPHDSVILNYRKTMAATMMRGPLVLARACRAGTKPDQLYSSDTVNGKPGLTLKLTQRPNEVCWGCWDAVILQNGKPLEAFPVCDFQSAADSMFGAPKGDTFSIWV